MTPQGPAALPPGTILGAFEIVSMLGHGGMGAVYAARNRITGDMRAVKVILPELAARQEFVGRFVREIRLAMAVEHPHLVRVFEPGMHGELIFLPMELLQGESLATFLRRERLVSIEAANNLVQAIGSAIVALHAKGILHRDVKPSNVFLAHERGTVTPKLLDLGAGKDVDGSEENTSTGLAIGSPHYMAPEQASGRKDLDGRVDQYSLGTLAYQLLTGVRPYENDDTGHVLAKVLSGAPYRLPREILASIPPSLEAVVLKAMARSREDRFPTMQDFLSAMYVASTQAANAALVPAPPPAPPPPYTNRPPAPTDRSYSGIDPAGIAHTGTHVAAHPKGKKSSNALGAAVGVGAGVVVVLLGVSVVRVVALKPVPANASAPPPAVATVVAHPAPPAPPPSAPPMPEPVASAAAPAPPSTGAPSSSAEAELDPPPVHTAPPAPPPATPSAEPAAASPPLPTPTPTPSEPTAAPRPRKAKPDPTAVEPCHPSPGAPCL